MKDLTPEQRDWIYDWIADNGIYEGNWVRVGVDRFCDFLNANTEPENLTLDVDKGDKTPRNGADCQAHTEPEDDYMVRVAPFLARLIEPRYDSDETNDYICNSTDCENALRAYKDWLQQEDKNE